MTDYLRYVEEKFKLHALFLEPLTAALERSGASRVVDLCSGSGGPLAVVLRDWEAQGRRIEAVFTDLYPHAASDPRYYHEPVDARAVPPQLTGLRTIFNGFHHFRPDDAKRVLADAVQAGQPIAVFEVADRSAAAIAPLILVPVFVLVLTPFIRPFRWSRLFWTYLIPVMPPAILWDGVVSYLRAYTPDELLALARAVEPRRYLWEAGHTKAPQGPGRATYLTGMRRPD